jgi:hypothetical protein
LVAELRKEQIYDLLDNDDHPFKSIEDGIESVLGRPLKSYKAQDPSSAYKVMKLLFKMQKTRHNRLFNFLKMPAAKRYSMEMREIFLFRRDEVSSEDAVWLITDLKTYLSLDLQEQEFASIQAAFWPLQTTVRNIRRGVDQVLTEAFGDDYSAALPHTVN